MKSAFKSALCGLAAVALFGVAGIVSPPAHATPILEGDNPELLIISGDKQFDNFFCTTTSVGTTGGGCTSLSVFALVPSGTQDPGLQFIGGLSATGATSVLDVFIEYDVTDLGGAILQLSLLFNGTLTNLTALASITETAENAGGDILASIAVSAPSDLQDPAFEVGLDMPLPAPETFLHIGKDILLVGSAGPGSATISLIEQNFKQISEPASLGLFGFGLIALGLLSRRSRRRVKAAA